MKLINYLIVVILIFVLESCNKPIESASEMIEANLQATSQNVNWNDFNTKETAFNLKTIIGGNTVSDVEKVIYIKIPYLQKTVTNSNDTLSGIIITNIEGSSTIKFENGKFFGINESPKEPVRITPILELKKNLYNFILKDTIWNDKSVLKLVNDEKSEEYVFDKESKFLIAYISDNRYGKSTMTYSDYKDVSGYMLPFKEEVNIPQAGYKLDITYSEIKANPTFTSDLFELDESWSGFTAGQKIPNFELPLVSDASKLISNKDFTGKVTLIDFWATWCKPCIEELPNIKSTYNKFMDKGFEVVSISIDNKMDIPLKYSEKNPFPWKYSLYLKDGFKSNLAKRFQLITLPKPVLVDADGKIIALDEDVRGEKLNKLLETHLKQNEIN